ncbi:class I SAM-dependent methyltransferase [Ochrobactrum sp. GPK 3]|uniref:class I SAM-dependent methyltransferase n=1 Tax=Brucella sp. 22210 TaxID=3453892 RepID=UPI0031385C35
MSDNIPLKAGRNAFGLNSQAYNNARPEYPPRIFEILRQHGASQAASVFEVGPGSGQATTPLLALGCTITAIEPDARLAAVLDERLRHDDTSLTIMQSSFEDCVLHPGKFDLGVSATAFHWLKQESALAKVLRLLRPGGWWAMWWTVFGDPDDMDPFQRRTREHFRQLSRSPSHAAGSSRPFALDKEVRMAELKTAGFEDAKYEEIRWNPTLTTRQVIDLTATFSPVSRLAEAERFRFLSDIGRIADDEFDGHVRRNFVTAIYLARKPERL